jgi:predicted small lipoprotein YifL
MRKVSTRSALALLAIITVAACGPTSPDSAPPAQGSARNAAAGIPAEVLTDTVAVEAVSIDGAPTEEFGLVEDVARANRVSCAIDRRSLLTASEAYFAEFGVIPLESDLVTAGFFLSESERSDLLPDGIVVAAGDCIGIEEPSDADLDAPDQFGESGRNRCAIDSRVLETAVQAFLADFGSAPPAESALIPTYLDIESETYDLGPDGSVVVAAGGPCA